MESWGGTRLISRTDRRTLSGGIAVKASLQTEFAGDVSAEDIWLWFPECSGSSKGRQTMLTACNPISRRCICCSRFVVAELSPFLSVSQLASCFGSRQHRLASLGNRLLQAWRGVSGGLECLVSGTLTAVMYMLLLLSLPLECAVARHPNDKNLCRTASGRASAARMHRRELRQNLMDREERDLRIHPRARGTPVCL